MRCGWWSDRSLLATVFLFWNIVIHDYDWVRIFPPALLLWSSFGDFSMLSISTKTSKAHMGHIIGLVDACAHSFLTNALSSRLFWIHIFLSEHPLRAWYSYTAQILSLSTVLAPRDACNLSCWGISREGCACVIYSQVIKMWILASRGFATATLLTMMNDHSPIAYWACLYPQSISSISVVYLPANQLRFQPTPEEKELSR